MKKVYLIFLIFSCATLVAKDANAQLFNVTATRSSNSQSVSASFNSAQDALNYFKGDNLNQAFGTNVDGEAVSVSLNYRGLNSTLSYDTSNNLTLNIPGIVSNKVFAGGSRDASVDLLKDYLKSDGGAILNQINKRLAAVSPNDPIAGNPISLMSQMVDDDFELTFVDSLHDSDAVDKNGKRVGNEMGAGVKYENYNVSGINSTVVSLSPFSYRRNINNSGIKLLLKVPVLRAISTEGARTYQASAAAGVHVPLYKNYWSIAPLASIGASASQDLGAAGAMNGVSITNKLKYLTDNGLGFHLGTLYGTYQTQRLQVNGYVSDPGIKNNILKNSFVVSLPTSVLQHYFVDFSVTNTKFYGTDLYIQNALDYGVGLVKSSKTDNNEFRLDLKYYSYNAERIATIGNGTSKVTGLSLNLKVQY